MSEHTRDVNEAAFDDVLLQSDQPVLVDFWAPWCGPCRAMTPAVEAVAQKYAGTARVLKLNVDESPAVSSRFNIRGIPTLILFKDGKRADRLVGLAGTEQISALIEKHRGVNLSDAAPNVCPDRFVRIQTRRMEALRFVHAADLHLDSPFRASVTRLLLSGTNCRPRLSALCDGSSITPFRSRPIFSSSRAISMIPRTAACGLLSRFESRWNGLPSATFPSTSSTAITIL